MRREGRSWRHLGSIEGWGKGGGLLRALSARVFPWGGWSKSGVWESRACKLTERTCVCARALASLCAFASPGVSGPGISNIWVDIWLRKFGVGELEICVGDGGGSVAISLWLQKRW